MAERSIFTAREAEFLEALVDNNVEFMIVGLSAALLQGAPAITQDVDLWFRDLNEPGLRKALKQVGGAYVPPIGANPPMLAGESVRLFDIVLHLNGLDTFDEESKRAIKMDVAGVEVRVLPLERIIASKEAANRPKDRLVLPVLRDAAIALARPGKTTKRGSERKERRPRSS